VPDGAKVRTTTLELRTGRVLAEKDRAYDLRSGQKPPASVDLPPVRVRYEVVSGTLKVHPAGSQPWSAASVTSPPLTQVDDVLVYEARADGLLGADVLTGRKRWTARGLGLKNAQILALPNADLILGASVVRNVAYPRHPAVLRLQPRSGRVLWRHELRPSAVVRPANGLLVFGKMEQGAHVLEAIRQDTGQAAWRRVLEGPPVLRAVNVGADTVTATTATEVAHCA
jgi:hypothetical protein